MDRPQPDFNVISTRFIGLGEEISAKCNDLGREFLLCSNIPAVAQGNEIANALNRLNESINRIDQNIIGVHTRLDRIETGIRSGEKNTVARLWNSRPLRPGQTIYPLVATSTGEVAPNFPATLTELDRLASRQINDLLRYYEQPVDGTSDEKRQRLMIFCGITLRSS
ncbi:hypothetical protein GGR58DRAFT_495131 [Xylaria digitata]|nr:hypothetical protein GGR58DRAFT_495131 [Xylaria digitata]